MQPPFEAAKQAASSNPYAAYLRLPELLALQEPLSPAVRTAQWRTAQWRDEHLFIVVHQAAELLLSHALVELWQAREAPARTGGRCPVVDALRRVRELLDQLEHLLGLLDSLTPAQFHAFRPLLGEASGGQSLQFAALLHQIDSPDCGLPAHARTAEVAGPLEQLRTSAQRWKLRHLRLVERMIGDTAGTGGTDGVDYLRSRIDPEVLHQGAHPEDGEEE
ncbi:tryptophan 2,3-dioxygenase family protein [Streptomyces sp. NPDC058335]|uniref:tryptophan 2,3-dioxygenase family protein n=1 Tax=Streptomyces sp. NPDC058335 TaxID=3346451 RepID=UPI003663B2E9